MVDQLRNGSKVIRENYDSVTVMFCDIHGFTDFAHKMSPLEATNLLNSMYSTFDPLVAHYDAYKVETIGSTYMVLSFFLKLLFRASFALHVNSYIFLLAAYAFAHGGIKI